MLNEKVIKILGEMSSINDSIVIKYPVTYITSQSSDVMATIDLSQFDSEQFDDIGLYGTFREFLAIFNFFEKFTTSQVDNTVIITSEDKKSVSTFQTDNITLLDKYDKDFGTVFNRIEEATCYASFKITNDDIKKIKGATNIYKDLGEVIFSHNNDEFKITLGSATKNNTNRNSFSILKDAQTTAEFSANIPHTNFKMIPNADYNAKIVFSEKTNRMCLLITSEAIESFKILFSLA